MAKTLLLVDDSVTIREVVALTFEKTDLTVRTADETEGAWKILQQEGADIVVADADKSSIGGWELCRRIKGDPTIGSTPVVLFSSGDEEAPAPQGVTPDALLSKPFGSEDLRRTVAALIDLDVGAEPHQGEPHQDEPTPDEVAPAEPAPGEPSQGEAPPSETPSGETPGEPSQAAAPETAEAEGPADEEGAAPDREDETPKEAALPEKEEAPSMEETPAEAEAREPEAAEAVRSAVEAAVREALSEALQGLDEEEIRRGIASGVRDALKDLAPEITGLVEAVAREVVPELAEIWIEREIQRLKEEG